MSGAAALPIGVVGVGSLGFHHARLLREVPGAVVGGIYDADAARAASVGEQLGVHVCATLDELFAGVEAAVVAVPTTAHAEVALEALRRGVHLLIEKPIAPTLQEADAIVQLAAEKGLVLATGHVERYNSVVRACEAFMDEPRFIESHRLSPFGPRGTDVAVVLDLMIHDIDLVLSIAGREVAAVDAVGVPVLTPNVDIANARLRFRGGAVANITASRVSRERLRKVRFFQPSGYISLDLAQGVGEFLRLRPDAALAGLAAGTVSLEDVIEHVEIRGDGKQPLQRELEAFVTVVRGGEDVIVSGEEGRRALAVALEIVGHIDAGLAEAGTAAGGRGAAGR